MAHAKKIDSKEYEAAFLFKHFIKTCRNSEEYVERTDSKAYRSSSVIEFRNETDNMERRPVKINLSMETGGIKKGDSRDNYEQQNYLQSRNEEAYHVSRNGNAIQHRTVSNREIIESHSDSQATELMVDSNREVNEPASVETCSRINEFSSGVQASRHIADVCREINEIPGNGQVTEDLKVQCRKANFPPDDQFVKMIESLKTLILERDEFIKNEIQEILKSKFAADSRDLNSLAACLKENESVLPVKIKESENAIPDQIKENERFIAYNSSKESENVRKEQLFEKILIQMKKDAPIRPYNNKLEKTVGPIEDLIEERKTCIQQLLRHNEKTIASHDEMSKCPWPAFINFKERGFVKDTGRDESYINACRTRRDPGRFLYEYNKEIGKYELMVEGDREVRANRSEVRNYSKAYDRSYNEMETNRIINRNYNWQTDGEIHLHHRNQSIEHFDTHAQDPSRILLYPRHKADTFIRNRYMTDNKTVKRRRRDEEFDEVDSESKEFAGQNSEDLSSRRRI